MLMFGWMPLGAAAFILVLINLIRGAMGKRRGWQILLFASLSCGLLAMMCALLEINGYVQERLVDSLLDVEPTLAKLSVWAVFLGIALNLIALCLHMRTEKKENG